MNHHTIQRKQTLLKDLLLLRDHICRFQTTSSSSTSGVGQENKNTPPSAGVVFPSRILLARINQEIQAIQSPDNRICKRNQNAVTNRVPWGIRLFLKGLRISFLDVPLTLLFSIVMLSWIVQFYYNHYISPTIDAANWIENDAARLQHEFTYYARECDGTDVTTNSLQDVFVKRPVNKNGNDTDATVMAESELHSSIPYHEEAVEILMTHGMAIFPSLLDSNTSEELRSYILKRNLELSADEVIPLDTPQNRWSFGIHANEHPSVANALSKLSSNVMLEATLSELLGEDPAVAEITAISVAPGAEAQGWHSDVKQLGNSVKYAQTFTHSYSLFIPLQDVTDVMGATELCPGTHYCADEDLHDVCVENGFQAAGSAPEDVWRTGDGLLMNQKMWHRGAAYTANDGPYRVVFIITFISRPNFGRDHRQLSHGTYFHIHPHMYGHTWNDLKRAQSVMIWPFAPLRSLGVWKPPNANWGWDWVTTSATRIANDQNGYMYWDLLDFVDSHPIAQRIPKWLHGSATEEGGWQLYFHETIDNFVLLGVVVYTVVFLCVLGIMLSMDMLVEGSHKNRTKAFVKRTLWLNAIVLVASYQVVLKLKSTPYAKSVEEGTIFARPFVAKPGRSSENVIDDILLGTKSPRLTTIPEKNDVLFGNRFDSKTIGYYRNFLNYHPGNIRWRQYKTAYSELFKSYARLPASFQLQIQSIVEDGVTRHGRFLTQNQYGEWIVMDQEDLRNHIGRELNIGMNSIEASLDKELDVLIANVRHGILTRFTELFQIAALRNLVMWKKIIMPTRHSGKHNNHLTPLGSSHRKKFILRTSLFLMKKDFVKSSTYIHQKKSTVIHHILNKVMEPKVGDVVLANFRGSGYLMPATVIHIEYGDYGVIEFNIDRGQYDHGGGERSDVYLKKTKLFHGVEEKNEIAILNRKCDRCPITFENASLGTCFPDLTCEAIHNDGRIQIIFKEEFALRV